MYVLGNPLKYTDPTGHFTQDEIMEFFGVDTWEEVLARFEDGGFLQGRWGWLEILRQGQEGDYFYVHGGASLFDWYGKFVVLDGKLWIDTYRSGYHSMGKVATQYDYYRIRRFEPAFLGSEAKEYTFETDAYTRYDRFRLDTTWSRVDKVDAVVDGVGLAGDAAVGLFGYYGAPVWFASEVLELGTVGRTWDQLEVSALDTDLGPDDTVAWWGVARAVGEPIRVIAQ
jgi:hypothetical protein